MDTGQSALGAWHAPLKPGLLVAPDGLDVVGIEPGDGADLWRRTLPTGPRMAALTPESGLVLVGGVVGFDRSGAPLPDLHALDPAGGAVVWSLTAGGVFAHPEWDGTTAYVASTHALLAIDVGRGTVRWHVDYPRTAGGFPGGPGLAAPRLVESLVITGAADARLHAYEAASGDERWSLALERSLRAPVAVDGDAIICTSGKALIRVRAIDGREIWRLPISGEPSFAGPLVDASTIFMSTGTGRSIIAVDARDGSLRWETSLGALSFGRPVLTRTIIWVTDTTGRLTALRRADGAIIWQEQVADGYLSEPTIERDQLVVGTGTGELVLFRAAVTASPPAPSHLLRVAPNPAFGAVTITGAPGMLEIHDALGRRRATLPMLGTGAQVELRWDGRDQRGHRLPPGVYFLRLRTPRGVQTGKVQLFR
jgi:outer membrane protein assembly factor BamB